MAYSGRETGISGWAPKKRFSSFHSAVFKQKIRWSSDHHTAYYFEMRKTDKKVEAKEETVNESALIYLTA